jgi:DNA-binding transcriptional MerR regulator
MEDLTMKQFILEDVCELAGVTERAVRDYENMGMIAPIGRNEQGNPVYNEEILKTIRTIKKYRTFGFTLKDTAYLMNADDFVRKACIRTHLSGIRRILGYKELLGK